MYMCTCSNATHVGGYSWKPHDSIWSPGTGAVGSYELPNMSAGSQTWVIWKSSSECLTTAHHSSPCANVKMEYARYTPVTTQPEWATFTVPAEVPDSTELDALPSVYPLNGWPSSNSLPLAHPIRNSWWHFSTLAFSGYVLTCVTRFLHYYITIIVTSLTILQSDREEACSNVLSWCLKKKKQLA